MKAAITRIFNNKRYKEIQSAYQGAVSKYKLGLEVWANHEALTITEDFEFKTSVADNIQQIKLIQSWVQTYNRLKNNCRKGLLWFYSERGQSLIPEPQYDDYKLIAEKSSYIEVLQGYENTHERLMNTCREAVNRFLQSSGSHSYSEIKHISLNENKIKAISEILKKAHECEAKYKSAWKVFAKGRSFDHIPLSELEKIDENSFDTKNLFLYLYDMNPELSSLILGDEMIPIDFFSEEAIAQEEELTILLASSDGQLPKFEIEEFNGNVSLEPGKELKRAILDSLDYGERCNFVDSYGISKFYDLRKDFDLIGASFDEAIEKTKSNRDAIKAFNNENGGEAKVFIEDYLKSVTESSLLYKYIETYTKEREKRDEAKRIQKNYPKGFEAIFGSMNLDTCLLQYILGVINSKDKIINKDNELKELERQRIERERKRQEEERKRKELRDLRSCVSSWPQPNRSSVDCFSLYYYYPTTCDWDASEDEWDVRNLIWDFKANPNRPQSEAEIKRRHDRATNEIIPEIKRVLSRYFGNQKTKLTFVCIPSSKKIVTERRYKDFAEIICNETGMTNGYYHVHIAEEGEASHLGGVVQAQFSVNGSFFKDRYVILFDDVITSGKSMERFKRLLESAGATVIGGLSIGKTKHERHQSNPIDEI